MAGFSGFLLLPGLTNNGVDDPSAIQQGGSIEPIGFGSQTSVITKDKPNRLPPPNRKNPNPPPKPRKPYNGG
ncbi:hypothetical protein FEM48_Zijuj04G0068000 [Ziziphus jujuba var. spinosa]|uniref:Uncharacterized protein n=1 Tax=Ziziphus jujuba var. spinosa TaxID=714518 RepID=A0A978VIE7_ZIZJJ|nr:hypothetical protein FEM48_Zijuj04G0068000 [Ziziphus jujuba var. spinosa]